MKDVTKKELHKQLVDEFISRQFKSCLDRRPGNRIDAALYVTGRIEALLLDALQELPGSYYNELIHKLKG
jgi:hypothetical protein